MISINGVELSDDLIIENEYDDPGIAVNVNHTLGGPAVIETQPLEGGREFTLSARTVPGGYSGRFTKTQADQLDAIKRAGTTVVFIYEAATYNVRITALKIRPLTARPNQDLEDEYTGTVTLIEV